MYHGERFNSITHLLGTVLAVSGSVVVIADAARGGDPWKIVSFSVFGTMLVVLYAASTLYHSISATRAKAVFRRLDHCAIYLLIAGTYTPFTLVTLRGALGGTLFATIWTMALFGIVRAWRRRGDEDPSVWPYVVMGWLAVVAAVPLITQLGGEGIAWLSAGSGLYMAGIVFYVNDTRWRHAHGIWHLFVLGGSAAHFIAIAFYVA